MSINSMARFKFKYINANTTIINIFAVCAHDDLHHRFIVFKYCHAIDCQKNNLFIFFANVDRYPYIFVAYTRCGLMARHFHHLSVTSHE